jgi:NADH-quinone oxidoreductase subunit N
MIVGAFGAFMQVRIKRFIAYASISQVGFIFLGIASCNLTGLIASLIYLILYSVMSLGFFTLLLNSNHIITGRNMLYLSDLYCFCLYNIESSEHLVLIILSMAGLPPLGGFVGKLFLYFSVMEARLDLTILFSLFLSIVSVYYYLSFVRYLWFEKYKVLKLYYYKKEIILNLILRGVSFFLILFLVIFPKVLYLFIGLGLSCMCPLI